MTVRATLLASIALGILGGAAAFAADEGWIDLSRDLSAWQEPTGEWFLAGDAKLNPQNARRLVGVPGAG